ncbi:hypothetical protein C8I07_18920 [Shewanella baltica]|nr:hypothetical protein C8I07_18920 [Shewanella baltica]
MIPNRLLKLRAVNGTRLIARGTFYYMADRINQNIPRGKRKPVNSVKAVVVDLLLTKFHTKHPSNLAVNEVVNDGVKP